MGDRRVPDSLRLDRSRFRANLPPRPHQRGQVDRLVVEGRRGSEGEGIAGAQVGQICRGGDAEAGAGGHNAMGADRGQIVGASGQSARDPHDLPLRVGDDLEIHGVAAVLCRSSQRGRHRPGRTRRGCRHEHILRIGCAQGMGQAGSTAGEETGDVSDVGVGGADADPEAGSDLREGFVLAQVHSATRARCEGRSLQRRRKANRVLQSKVIVWSFLQNLPKIY